MRSEEEITRKLEEIRKMMERFSKDTLLALIGLPALFVEEATLEWVLGKKDRLPLDSSKGENGK